MRLVVFASGSTGNCCLVEGGGVRVLIDAGISARRVRTALREAGTDAAELTAILVTHEHYDHIRGLPVLARYTEAPVYAPGSAVRELIRTAPALEPRLREIWPETPFPLGAAEIMPFATSHDTPQSVGYRLTAGEESFALATDTGCVTEPMRRYLAGARIALVEANHDIEMLKSGPYPPALKKRILSDRGHLSNDDCASLAVYLAERGTRRLVLGHLSRENNLPALALRTVRRALADTDVRVECAPELGFLEVETDPCFA